ncbi:hypothetical protein EYD46_03975 [Hyunsoonleella pacifica]|uniref:Uncharacterized protein n=1 Tax=Hyunsoonleella pacifica TaxID=1080224 RepID=A0A4V2JBA0_9FLAO|nr:hypothetical protein EYD46_03975 [Hyunsoonleella pacifica]
MKFSLHNIITLVLLIINSYTVYATDNIQLITTTTTFVAGEDVTLKFKIENNTSPSLYISNSFGSTLIKAHKTDNILSYNIPLHLSSRVGTINWVLLAKPNSLQGSLKITPQNTVNTIQNYLGPPSITAGGNDYSMLVAIPIDNYDNPLAKGTKVAVKHQFHSSRTIDTIFIKNNISYKNIYSTKQTGRILLNSSCLEFNSKEYDINVMPAPPTNFNIGYSRHHNYADGNQITTFTTSIIKDKYGNIVSDGTYVDFFIKNGTKTVLKTSGTTIKGLATAKMIHPDHADTWEIQAFIDGMAESNSIKIDYKTVISDFNIEFSNDNRNITVGPLKSFMDQMIPDGLQVTLYIYSGENLVHTKHKSSSDGYVTFTLNVNQFPKGTYNITIKVAGNSKSVNTVKL